MPPQQQQQPFHGAHRGSLPPDWDGKINLNQPQPAQIPNNTNMAAPM